MLNSNMFVEILQHKHLQLFSAKKLYMHFLKKVLSWQTYSGTSVLRKTSTALQLTVQFSPGCKLEDEIHTRCIMEVAIEAQDIRVPAGCRCRGVFSEILLKFLPKVSEEQTLAELIKPLYQLIPQQLLYGWAPHSEFILRQNASLHESFKLD